MDTLPPGFANCTIHRTLGSGGMGSVHLATDHTTGAQVALKVLHDTQDLDLRLRFQREAEAHARASTHPHVLTIHRAGVDRGLPFLVVALATHGDLHTRLQHGPLPPDRAVTIITQLAQGLAHLHQLGILHRDIKPANVLFDEHDRPLWSDFGLARALDADTLTRTGEILGTPATMAPEQARGDHTAIGPHTDIYGLGALLYHTLTGQPHIRAGSLIQLALDLQTHRPTPPHHLDPSIPTHVSRACLRALHPDPHRRFPSADAFAHALLAPPPPSRKPLLLLLLLPLLLLPALFTPSPDTPATDPTPTQPDLPHQPPPPVGASLADLEAWLLDPPPGADTAPVRDRWAELWRDQPLGQWDFDAEVFAAVPLGGRRALIATDLGIHLLDLRATDPLHTWAHPQLKPRCLAVSPDGERVLVGSDDGDLAGLFQLSLTDRDAPPQPIPAVPDRAEHLAWHPTLGPLVATRIGFFRLDQHLNPHILFPKRANALALDPDGRAVASFDPNSADGRALLRIWSRDLTRPTERRLPLHFDGLNDVAFPPHHTPVFATDDNHLTSSDHPIQPLWTKRAPGINIHTHEPCQLPIRKVEVSADGRWIALSAGNRNTNGLLQVRRLEDGATVRPDVPFDHAVRVLCLHPSGAWVLAGGDKRLEAYPVDPDRWLALPPDP